MLTMRITESERFDRKSASTVPREKYHHREFKSEGSARYLALTQPSLTDLKRSSVRGGFATVSAQGLRFVIQTATTMVLARLLSPRDFGLQGMVVVITSFLALFQDAGLSMATVQSTKVTHEQTSTLFWVNVAFGTILAILCAALAPLLVAFYHEPNLYWIAVISGATFIFNGLAAQHQALLTRGMRFVTQAKFGVLSLLVGSVTGIVMALLGCRYWSLVGMAIASSIVGTALVWLAVPWMPGPPRRKSGIRSMLHFGGLATCNSFVVFLSWNAEKILLGHFWGSDALGLYGRAYQLVTLPVQQLNGAIGNVAFPALSRIQHDAKRLAASFLTAYSLLISLTIPVTITCALFAEEIVGIVLGAKWMATAPIFRLLAPVAVVFTVGQPLSWLITSRGRIGRALAVRTATAPLMILGIVLGLGHGPIGVALCYSLAMTIVLIPVAACFIHGTGITWMDLLIAAKPPFLSGLLAATAGLVVKLTLAEKLPLIPFLFVGVGTVLGIYALLLLIVMNQKRVYWDLLSCLFPQLCRTREDNQPEAARCTTIRTVMAVSPTAS
jgi:O-antigen/teichoic acid export membrane protein